MLDPQPSPQSLSLPVALPTVKRLSPSTWAYLGDAVYELYVRSQWLLPARRLQQYHQQVVACVRAEAQAQVAQQLLPQLTTSEAEIFKQGRNAGSVGPKRLDPAIYRQATALEALIGYLYLTDPQRLEALLQSIDFEQILANSIP